MPLFTIDSYGKSEKNLSVTHIDSLSQDQYNYRAASQTYLVTKRKASVAQSPLEPMDRDTYRAYRLRAYRKKFFEDRFYLKDGASYKMGPLFLGFKKPNFFDLKLDFIYRITAEADLGLTRSVVKSGVLPDQVTFLTRTDFPIDVSLNGKIGKTLQIDLNYNTQSEFSRIQDVFRVGFQRPVTDVIIEETLKDSDRSKKELAKAKQYAKRKLVATLPQDTLQLGGKQLSGTTLTSDQFYEVEFDKIKQQRLSYLNNFVPTKERVVTNVNDIITGQDEIIKNVAFGSVQFPLQNTLMQSSQDLFGLRADFQFGRTTIKSVIARQQGTRKVINTQGEDVIEPFELTAFDYDENRHFFLSHYFRAHFEDFLKNAPFISSPVYINRVEAWILNYSTDLEGARNVVAFADLGENQSSAITTTATSGTFILNSTTQPPKNNLNLLDPNNIGQTNYLGSDVRSSLAINSSTSNALTNFTISDGINFTKIRNAKQLSSKEFSFHPQLGFITLNTHLPTDGVLAVAFEYTYKGNVYQVGEFSNLFKGEDENNNLVIKLLKGPIMDTSNPIWDLMMKNIYNIGGWGISEDDFKLDILYGSPSLQNYFSPVGGTPLPTAVQNKPLLQLFNLDRLNPNKQIIDGGDGFFDYLENITVHPKKGIIMFPLLEPFGEHIFNQLSSGGSETYTNEATYNSNQTQYVLRDLYTTTKILANNNNQDKNRYVIKGKYKSSSSQGISLGTYDLSRGSVTVVGDGRILKEGIDYAVNYDVGRVYIINPSLKNTPLTIHTESRNLFNSQIRNFYGVDVEHKLSDKFKLGGSFLRLSEKPVRKINAGNETVKNNLFGFHSELSQEIPSVTRLLNKLPFVKTQKPSVLKIRGEYAYLDPSVSYNKKVSDKPFSYIDNFEGVAVKSNILPAISWTLSSTPSGFEGSGTGLEPGYKRAKLSWYQISPDFYAKAISGVTDDMLSTEAAREVEVTEIYPNVDLTLTDATTIQPLTLTYYPDRRGPYNYNPTYVSSISVPAAQSNWGGIVRKVPEPNFEQANIKYLEFWLLDPFVENAASGGGSGDLIFDIGLLSEDVLPDGVSMYENGLPTNGSDTTTTSSTDWGIVPKYAPYSYIFSSNNQSDRTNQDKGLDGLTDSEEQAKFTTYATDSDPSADNYVFYGAASGSSLADYYLQYNGQQGNTPFTYNPNNLAGSSNPDVEDIDKDYNLNTAESYYRYTISLSPSMTAGTGFLNDVREVSVQLANGGTRTSRWLQFKVPLDRGTANSISDMRTMRHMRMYLTGFSSGITLRFGTLALVKTNWRKQTEPSSTTINFEVTEVNLFENNSRTPVPYVLPPGINRETSVINNQNVEANEQSLALKVTSLPKDSIRYVYKDIHLDARLYKNFNIFVHAEHQSSSGTGDLATIIRLGSDDTENYYEIEKPLQFTAHGASLATDIWPNELEIPFSLLTQAKTKRISQYGTTDRSERTYNAKDLDPSAESNLTIRIKGNPSLGIVKRIALGVKNTNTSTGDQSIEVWFNEMGLSDYENDGGWAGKVDVSMNFSNLGTASLSFNKKTDNFGPLEQKPTNQGREDVQTYTFQTNWDFGLFLPVSWKLKIPFEYTTFKQTAISKYDAYDTDLEVSERIDVETDQAAKDKIKERSTRYQNKHTISIPELSKGKAEGAKDRIYNLSNFKLGYLYTNSDYSDFELENKTHTTLQTSLKYNYKFKDRKIQPFKNSKFLDKNYLKFIKDFNLNLMPSSFTMNTDVNRTLNKQQFRQIEFATPNNATYYQLDYKTKWHYSIGYNPFESVKITYTGARSNYLDINPQEYGEQHIHTKLFKIGTPQNQNHTTSLTYDIPFKKIPILNLVNGQYNYKGTANWKQVSPIYQNIEASDGNTYDLGNTLENRQEHNFTLSFSPYASIQQYYAKKKRASRRSKHMAKSESSDNNKSNKQLLAKIIKHLGLSIRSIKGTYQESRTTSLPGFLPSVNFIGINEAGFLFNTGLKQNIERDMASKGFLTSYPDMSDPIKKQHNKIFNSTINIVPKKNIIITLNQKWSHSNETNETFVVTDNQFQSQSLYKTGNFTSSDIFLKTSLFKPVSSYDGLFSTFKTNRKSIAHKLATDHYGHTNYALDADGFPIGFNGNSSEVLTQTFLSTYRGKSGIVDNIFRNIPLPNWKITIKNLHEKINFLHPYLKTLTFNHAYNSSYTISNYSNNLLAGGLDGDGNVIPDLALHNILISEHYSPLGKLTAQFKNDAQFGIGYTMDREVMLNLDNNSISENLQSGILLNFGYKVKRAFGTRNPLNLTTDISFKQSRKIFRDLNREDGNTLSANQFITFNIRANYRMSKTYSFTFYVDYSGEEYQSDLVTTKKSISLGGKVRATFF